MRVNDLSAKALSRRAVSLRSHSMKAMSSSGRLRPRPVTSFPSFRACATTARPTNPEAPVTSKFSMGLDLARQGLVIRRDDFLFERQVHPAACFHALQDCAHHFHSPCTVFTTD